MLPLCALLCAEGGEVRRRMLLQERTEMCRAAVHATIKSAMRELEDAARKEHADGSKRPRKLSIPLARVKKIMQQSLKNPHTHIRDEAVLMMTYARPIHESSVHAPATWVALPPAAPAARLAALAQWLAMSIVPLPLPCTDA